MRTLPRAQWPSFGFGRAAVPPSARPSCASSFYSRAWHVRRCARAAPGAARGARRQCSRVVHALLTLSHGNCNALDLTAGDVRDSAATFGGEGAGRRLRAGRSPARSQPRRSLSRSARCLHAERWAPVAPAAGPGATDRGRRGLRTRRQSADQAVDALERDRARRRSRPQPRPLVRRSSSRHPPFFAERQAPSAVLDDDAAATRRCRSPASRVAEVASACDPASARKRRAVPAYTVNIPNHKPLASAAPARFRKHTLA